MHPGSSRQAAWPLSLFQRPPLLSSRPLPPPLTHCLPPSVLSLPDSLSLSLPRPPPPAPPRLGGAGGVHASGVQQAGGVASLSLSLSLPSPPLLPNLRPSVPADRRRGISLPLSVTPGPPPPLPTSHRRASPWRRRGGVCSGGPAGRRRGISLPLSQPPSLPALVAPGGLALEAPGGCMQRGSNRQAA